MVRMKATSGSGVPVQFFQRTRVGNTALGSRIDHLVFAHRSAPTVPDSVPAPHARAHFFTLLTAWNFEPSIATHSPFTKPTERASRTNSAPAAGYALAMHALELGNRLVVRR